MKMLRKMSCHSRSPITCLTHFFPSSHLTIPPQAGRRHPLPASLKSGGVKGMLHFGEKPTRFGKTGFERGYIWGEMHPTWWVGSLTPKPCRRWGHQDRAAGAGT